MVSIINLQQLEDFLSETPTAKGFTQQITDGVQLLGKQVTDINPARVSTIPANPTQHGSVWCVNGEKGLAGIRSDLIVSGGGSGGGGA